MPPQALSFYHIINVERKEKSGEENKYKEIVYMK